VDRIAGTLRRQALPDNQDELGEYLRRLKEALVVAKVSRASAVARRTRVNAVSGFNKTRLIFAAGRHNSVESPDS